MTLNKCIASFSIGICVLATAAIAQEEDGENSPPGFVVPAVDTEYGTEFIEDGTLVLEIPVVLENIHPLVESVGLICFVYDDSDSVIFYPYERYFTKAEMKNGFDETVTFVIKPSINTLASDASMATCDLKIDGYFMVQSDQKKACATASGVQKSFPPERLKGAVSSSSTETIVDNNMVCGKKSEVFRPFVSGTPEILQEG